MLFASDKRQQYVRSPLVEVVCQLQFPTILRIGDESPTAFQEAIRHHFPHYSTHQDRPPLKIRNVQGNNPQIEAASPIRNHQFVSADHFWKLNITRDIFRFSTVGYTSWEEFARHLDRVLVAFLQEYQPDFFSVATLRYLNAFYRPKLGLQDYRWNQLIQPHLLGVLADDSMEETALRQPSIKASVVLEQSCELNLTAGLNRLPGRQKETEPSFLVSSTFLLRQQSSPAQLPSGLEQLHKYAVRLFNGIGTDTLYQAMMPRG